jgi:signal transduction histidine kinase
VLHTVYAWLRRHPRCADTLVAALPFGLSMVDPRPFPTYPLTAIALCAPLVVRRRYPVAVLLWVFGVGLLQVLTHSRIWFYDISIVIAIYTVTVAGPRWAARLAFFGGMTGGVVAALVYSHPPDPSSRVMGTALVVSPVVVAWLLGDNLRVRRAYLAGLEERAARLERERDAQARIAVAQERARIARELHDVVAHNVSVMVVQADGAGCALDEGELADTAEAIEAIGRTGRTALGEMRLLLGLLRSSTETDYAPQPDVGRIEELIGQVPLPVELTMQGVPRRPPPGVGLAAYRIVQEALTNAMKHAGPRASAAVRLEYETDGLRIAVTDDGPGPVPGGSPGHGIAGMRERAAMFGGSVEAGARPGGGFQVSAWLPWAGSEELSGGRAA